MRAITIRDFGTKKSMIRDGKEIAKFLKVALMDNYPYGKELLWGETDVSSLSISHLNEHLKDPKKIR